MFNNLSSYLDICLNHGAYLSQSKGDYLISHLFIFSPISRNKIQTIFLTLRQLNPTPFISRANLSNHLLIQNSLQVNFKNRVSQGFNNHIVAIPHNKAFSIIKNPLILLLLFVTIVAMWHRGAHSF